MARYNTSEFKTGLKVMLDGDPCNIIENEFVKPGKGQAFSRVKLRNLKNGRVLEKTFKSGESIEGADVLETNMQYLYFDGTWHFMDPESFEQYEVEANVAQEAALWLKEQDTCQVTLWNGAPISIMPPNFVHLAVAETDPGLKGDTSGGGSKAAILESGAQVRVPLFINVGDLLRIDTRTGDYVSKAKE